MRGPSIHRPFVKHLAAQLSDEERILLRLLAASDRDYGWSCWDGQRPIPARVLVVFCLAERFWVAAQLTWMLRITARGREILAALPALEHKRAAAAATGMLNMVGEVIEP